MIISLDFANYVSRGIGLNILLWEMINFPAKEAFEFGLLLEVFKFFT